MPTTYENCVACCEVTNVETTCCGAGDPGIPATITAEGILTSGACDVLPFGPVDLDFVSHGTPGADEFWTWRSDTFALGGHDVYVEMTCYDNQTIPPTGCELRLNVVCDGGGAVVGTKTPCLSWTCDPFAATVVVSGTIFSVCGCSTATGSVDLLG